MNRRDLFKLLPGAVVAAPVVANVKPPRFTNRKRYFGKFDYQAEPILYDPADIQESFQGLCLLNGVEVKSCCYANTATGIVKTFDVFHNGKIATPTTGKWRWVSEPRAIQIVDVTSHCTDREWREKIATMLNPDDVVARQVAQEFYSPADFPGRDVECPIDGVLCETLHGEVEIWGPEIG